MTLTAAEVVAEYLAKPRGHRGEFEEADKIIEDATRAIVEQLPDGFRRRDVTNCVQTLTENTPELETIKRYRRTLVAGKTLKKMVIANEISHDEDKEAYFHVSF